jgi:hypothetical protein
MQHRILIRINTQVGKTMLIFRPALKNECRSEENYSWLAKPASYNYQNVSKRILNQGTVDNFNDEISTSIPFNGL